MKKLYLILTMIVLSLGYAPGVFAVVDNQTTGVPLDGGLLALLAGAGIAYFAARKKKKSNL
ncbi:MAG TPA: hypothetical protein VE870_15810 [Bacteroidales bacterium]|nr:hypothetical protein [Bacteroidales bacterium]